MRRIEKMNKKAKAKYNPNRNDLKLKQIERRNNKLNKNK